MFDALLAGIERAVSELFTSHPERFYYLTLVVVNGLHRPVLSAMSEEALARLSHHPDEQALLRWSYVDSPYFAFADDSLATITAEWDGLIEQEGADQRLLDLVEAAVRELDVRGLFGAGPAREAVLVAVEVMPPEPQNTDRVMRLNRTATGELPSVVIRWLDDVAE